jgi:two-component system alkaline phosphatase synthesis response regulator PhoP
VSGRARGRRILIVDDDPEILDFLVTLLDLEGYAAVVANGGREALQLLSREEFALVLLDIAMPDLDGIELCKRIKGHPQTRAVPVFVVSARPGREVVDRSLAAGAEDFIRKPFENEELMDRIRRRLGAVGTA